MNERQPTTDAKVTLSEEGTARRDAMLGDLQQHMQRHHAMRRARRRTIALSGAGAALMLVAVLAWQSSIPSLLQGPAEHALNGDATAVAADIPRSSDATSTSRQSAAGRPADTVSAVDIRTVATTAGITDRYTAEDNARRFRFITIIESDEQLLRALAEVNHETGLIRIGTQVRLTRPIEQP